MSPVPTEVSQACGSSCLSFSHRRFPWTSSPLSRTEHPVFAVSLTNGSITLPSTLLGKCGMKAKSGPQKDSSGIVQAGSVPARKTRGCDGDRSGFPDGWVSGGLATTEPLPWSPLSQVLLPPSVRSPSVLPDSWVLFPPKSWFAFRLAHSEISPVCRARWLTLTWRSVWAVPCAEPLFLLASLQACREGSGLI